MVSSIPNPVEKVASKIDNRSFDKFWMAFTLHQFQSVFGWKADIFHFYYTSTRSDLIAWIRSFLWISSFKSDHSFLFLWTLSVLFQNCRFQFLSNINKSLLPETYGISSYFSIKDFVDILVLECSYFRNLLFLFKCLYAIIF